MTQLCVALDVQATPGEPEPAFSRTGAYLRVGAAVGFENSESLDDAQDLIDSMLPARIEDVIGPTPGVPAGTTLDSVRIDVDVFAGASAAAGYRAHPRLALEAAFDWMRADLEFAASATVPGVGSFRFSEKVADYTVWTLTAGLKAYLLTGRIQPYAGLGLGVMNQEIDGDAPGLSDSATAFTPRFGGGLDLYVTPSLLINADAGYLLTTGDLADNDVIGLRAAVAWRF